MTLVTRDDARMISDIERLIKKKIDLEPIELEDDRPRRPRRRDDDDLDRAPRAAGPALVAVADTPAPERFRRAAAASDPFFDRPYEPTGSGAAGWEAVARATPPGPTRGLSPNIRPKKKVASLLGGSR